MGLSSLLGVAAALLVLAPREARACSCMAPPPPAEARKGADAVFEGRAFSMSSDSRRAHYRFEVDRVWKGEVGGRVEISTALHSAACGRTYRIGTKYIVYARRSPDGDLNDGSCSRTRAIHAATEDLEVLGAGRIPRDPDRSEPAPEPGSPPTEPPRIEPPPPEPPPTAPGRRGCAVEKPHAPAGGVMLLGLGLAVAFVRRRAVRSHHR